MDRHPRLLAFALCVSALAPAAVPAQTPAPAASAQKKPAAKKPTVRPGVFRFAGTAIDNDGVASVEISLRRVSGGRSVRAAATKKPARQCTFFDGKVRFLRKSCKKPTFFRVVRRGNSWAYRVKAGTFLRTGTYWVTARAVDKHGNVSKPVTRRFTIR
jgi:hypothetical protein